MGTVKQYIPRQTIGGHRVAASLRPFVKSLTGADYWREAGGDDARRVNIRRVALVNDPTADDALAPGQIPTTPYVLLPTYKIGWFSVAPTDFTQVVSDRELAIRAEARTILDAEYTALQNKDNPTADERDRMTTLEVLGAQLADDGSGYINLVYDCMGTRAKGVWYGLAVGNVPLRWIYNKSIKPNRALSFRLKRLEAPRDQGNFEYSLIFGKKRTRYALVFGKDREIVWRHYKPLNAALRESLEDQLAEALDAGRLTADDERQLRLWDEEHARITAAARGRKKNAEEEASLAQLKKNEADLRDQKKFLSDAGRALAEEIEAKLFYDTARVSVPEYVKTTIGQPLDISIEWLRRGGVLITIGNNPPFVWFNKEITKTKKYGAMLEKGSQLEIRSTGGKWGIAFGAPIYDDLSLLYSAPYTLPAGAAGDIRFIGDTSPGPLTLDDGGLYWQTDADPALPDCFVRASVEILRAGANYPTLGVTTPTVYQTRLELLTAGDYAAEVHSLDLLIIPEVAALTGQIYDSEEHKDGAGVAHLIDLQISEGEGGSVVAKLFYRDGLLPNGTRESGLPATNLVGRVTDVSLITDDEDPATTIVWRGKIAEDFYPDLQSLAGATGTTTPAPNSEPDLDPKPNVASIRQLTVVSLEQIANKTADPGVSVNGLNIGDALVLCAKLAGYQADEYAALPTGPIAGLDPLPLAAAGTIPNLRPDDSATWLEFMRRLVKDHAPTYELTTGETGFSLLSLEEVDRPDLNYSEDAPIESDLRILRGLTLTANYDDFANRVVVIGALIEETKTRIVVEERLTTSTDPRYEGQSLSYVGEDVPFIYGPNESIDDDVRAINLARRFLDKKSRPPIGSPLRVPFRPDVKAGQLIYIKGRQWLVTKRERGHINSGEGIQTMDLYLRLCKDGIKTP